VRDPHLWRLGEVLDDNDMLLHRNLRYIMLDARVREERVAKDFEYPSLTVEVERRPSWLWFPAAELEALF
jgi:hypothetical protein